MKVVERRKVIASIKTKVMQRVPFMTFHEKIILQGFIK